MATPEHLYENHPGKIYNQLLLKPFDKYVRIDTKNENSREDLVCRRKIQKDKDYVLLTKNLWTFLSSCFGVDYTISRDKDGVRTSLF